MKAVFFDIDGTLDDFEGRIPASAKEAVRAARGKGALCIVNTGRPYYHILPEIKEIGFDGFVCSCGQHLVIGDKTVRRVRPTAEESRRIIMLAEKCRVDGYFESEDGCLVSFVHEVIPLVAFQIKDFQRRGVPVLLGYENRDFRLDKFCFWAGEDSDAETFIEGTKDLFTVIKKGGGDFEMVMNGCSKANGIRDILNVMGADGAETYAIGDSANDLKMLEAVHHPIAMGGAPKELVRLAEFTTDRLENDGLKKALEHFGLI
ncbi:MAG: HAD hydrolase family protein [Clostridiales bacterium]|nr:HAD hydrolase family protein [Clostridiales bacterium]